jgi:outer membrane receptor protein involved in Fe transport
LLVEGGSRETGGLSALAATQRHGWSLLGSLEGARRGRAPVVAESARGAIDTPAGSSHVSALAVASWTPGPALVTTLRVNPFGEDRTNGTPAQRNDTRSVLASAAASGTAGRNSWEVRAWGQRSRYGQTFSIIAAGRGSEVPTTIQRVDSDGVGVRGQWSRLFRTTTVVAGFEGRQVNAVNLETVAGSSTRRSAGGRQRGPAIFARLGTQLGPAASLEVGGRWETWSNRSVDEGKPRRADSFSPRVSMTWTPAGAVGLQFSAYRAFRAPTLNELYRGFRVGAISTLPNDALQPERLSGAEGGVTFTRRGVAARATGWWSRLGNPVTNVTTAPQQRQRQNVGEIHARGFEAEVVVRPLKAVEWTSALALTRSVFRDAERPALDGLRVPQVPGRQLSSRLRLVASPFWVSAEVRLLGRQFEDDLNELPLSPASVIDTVLGVALNRRFDVVFALENVADREVQVGRTPVPTVGLPRTFHVSLRYRSR